MRLSCCLSHDRCRDTWDTVPYISPPTFPDGATSSVSGTDRTLSEVRCGKCKKMHSPVAEPGRVLCMLQLRRCICLLLLSGKTFMSK